MCFFVSFVDLPDPRPLVHPPSDYDAEGEDERWFGPAVRPVMPVVPSPDEPYPPLRRIKTSPSVFAVLVYAASTSGFPHL